MKALVGYTGFVGSNICEAAGNDIDALYNSRNIAEAYGTNPDLLIYAGLRAEKYLANNAPEKDLELIFQAERNIEKIDPKKLVLISTIDIFKTPKGVDENSPVDTQNLHPYGYNRYLLEQWVREKYPDALIIRLPGLFGKNIKKNFIYDFIHVIPFMLKEERFEELVKRDGELRRFYSLQENGFYKVNVSAADRPLLKEKFRNLGFSALNFTDSRSKYQFYNLSHLWGGISAPPLMPILRCGILQRNRLPQENYISISQENPLPTNYTESRQSTIIRPDLELFLADRTDIYRPKKPY